MINGDHSLRIYFMHMWLVYEYVSTLAKHSKTDRMFMEYVPILWSPPLIVLTVIQ